MVRNYSSAARDMAAAETRGRIVETARRLMLEGGYRAMTVAELASQAGVSPQTVYNSLGGKAAVVKAVYDTMLAGDDEPVPMSARPEFLAIQAAEDIAGWASAYAAWSGSIMRRVGPLLGAILDHGPGGDPVLEGLVATMDRERRIGNEASLSGLVARGALSGAVTRRRAVDAVWTLTSPEVYDRLVIRCGWSEPAYERWLSAQLTAAIGA